MKKTVRRPARTAQLKSASRKTRTAPRKTAGKRRGPQTVNQHRGKEKSIMKKRRTPNTDRLVPDTSVLIEGALSQEIEHNNLTIKEIIVPEAVLAELESQANRRKEIGYLGLDEIERLKRLADAQGFTVRFAGGRPAEFEIKYAKSGEIDRLIRQVAEDENAVLYTADVVQSKVARAKGVPVILYHRGRDKPHMDIEDFFDETTMSV
ncbi:PIN domain-containing protein, partial [Candidatus Woesearchaeota archaeon]|nr:PIN domain-containing protein [Candidatus Woesearchaeota archaeon]